MFAFNIVNIYISQFYFYNSGHYILMAPTKSVRTAFLPKAEKVSTRSKVSTNGIIKEVRGKRKAECSPSKEAAIKKRPGLVDLSLNPKVKPTETKQKLTTKNTVTKKITVQPRIIPSVKTAIKTRQNENLPPPAAPINRVQTRATALRTKVPNETAQKPKEPLKDISNAKKVKTRLSNEFEKTDESSLYSSALEEM